MRTYNDITRRLQSRIRELVEDARLENHLKRRSCWEADKDEHEANKRKRMFAAKELKDVLHSHFAE